jgi:rod shape-determining protein MreC
VAAFGAGAYRPLPGRGASPGFRFFLYASLAIALMLVDHRQKWLTHVRYVLSAAAYPVQMAVNSPTAAWHWLEASFATRETLQAENARLRERERTLELKSLRFDALARENGELRGLKDALPPVAERWLVAETVNVELNSQSQRQRLLISRGAHHGVFEGQAVMDSTGLLGQTLHVGPWSAEIILITDSEHAVPVQIERTGVRTIAVGTGESDALALPYLPTNADVKPGDLLITSGLGGVFPQGYPVARVTEVRHDAVQPLAQIRAAPLARLDRLREVMLVWFRPDHPAAPSHVTGDHLTTGNPAFQPQPVPPRPAPAPAAAGPEATETPPTAAAGGTHPPPSGPPGLAAGTSPAHANAPRARKPVATPAPEQSSEPAQARETAPGVPAEEPPQ